MGAMFQQATSQFPAMIKDNARPYINYPRQTPSFARNSSAARMPMPMLPALEAQQPVNLKIHCDRECISCMDHCHLQRMKGLLDFSAIGALGISG
jgi:hypothetical protein